MNGQDRNQSGDPTIGDRFQQETKYTPEKIARHTLDWNRKPDTYKSYPETVKKVELPRIKIDGKANIWEVLQSRRSVRNYSVSKTMPLDELALLLWATQGITAATRQFEFRSAPSAGGLYPIESYLEVRDVESLEAGVYHFRPGRFDLEFIRPGNFGVQLAHAALGQKMASDAQVCFIWTAVVERSKWKYRQRAYRYVYLDAGHIAQNLYLAGTALGLGVCGIGAFFDDRVNGILDVDGVRETTLYLASVGCL
jgi:SagB-type dehydrogenase family enzyme